jgi:hypothetical protein
MLIGMVKGRTVDEKVYHNFGMPNPEGYRKALRLMKLAEKYNLPIVCMVDTPAAYPGKEAEERGQAEAIARNLTEMAGAGSADRRGHHRRRRQRRRTGYRGGRCDPHAALCRLFRDPARRLRRHPVARCRKGPASGRCPQDHSRIAARTGHYRRIIDEPPGGAHRDPETTIERTREAIWPNRKRLKRQSPRLARLAATTNLPSHGPRIKTRRK